MDYVDDAEALIIMNKWKAEWTDQLNQPKLDDRLFEDPAKINIDDLSIKMKNKLREYLIGRAKAGDYTKIHLLVSKGKASIETRNNDGQSLLSLAIIHGHVE